MSNGIFNTSRQLSVEERVRALAAQKANRASARTSLMEAATDAENKKKTEDELAKIDSDHEKDVAKEQRLEKLQETTFAANRRHDMMALESRLFQEGRQVLWNKILFETVYEANWVDDSVKQQIIQPMYETFESTMGFLKKTIPGAFTKNPTRLLEAMDTIVTETAKKAAKRITEEAGADVGSQPDRIPFNINQDEEDEFDKSLADLSTDEIADKVKAKVLTVVQDEKKAARTKADTMKEIDDAKKDDDDDPDTDDGTSEDESDSKSKKKDDSDTDDESDSKKKKDDDSDDEPSDDKDDKKSREDKGDDDKSESDSEDDSSTSDDSKSESKKKDKDSSDDDTEDVTEGVFNTYVPDEYYKEVTNLFTTIMKKSHGNNAHDATLHITKAGRVDITNFKAVKATGKRKFNRTLDLTPDDAMKIAKSCGFKRGTGKLLSVGVFMIKPVRGGGYAELQIADGYKSEHDSMGVDSGRVYASNASTAYSGTSVNMKYLKQAFISINFIPTVNKSLRERYMIESGIVYGKPDWKITLEQRVLEKKARELNTSTGNSIFESMMLAARVSVERDAVLENVQMSPNQIGDAMMIEAITRYTVLETLNTMGIVSLSYADGTALKKACLEEVTQDGSTKVMSVDDSNGGAKTTRINTQKYKRNNDAKVMSANN
jgi:hypothetical protein